MLDCNEWFKKTLPPKTKSKSQQHQNAHSSKLSAMDLQKLYSKDTKKALKKIQFTPEIHCEVDSVDLRYGLLTQLSSSGKKLDLKDLWQPCCEGRLELSQRFSKDEIVKALEHKNSAAGPDGWTYNDICKLKNFPEDFVRGLHSLDGNKRINS